MPFFNHPNSPFRTQCHQGDFIFGHRLAIQDFVNATTQQTGAHLGMRLAAYNTEVPINVLARQQMSSIKRQTTINIGLHLEQHEQWREAVASWQEIHAMSRHQRTAADNRKMNRIWRKKSKGALHWSVTNQHTARALYTRQARHG